MDIQQAKNTIVYFRNQYGEMESDTYYNFVREFGSDETTSPNGVAPRKHIRENGDGQFEIWSWGINGNRPLYYGDTFETKEEAEQCLFDYFEWEMETSDQTPFMVFSEEEFYHETEN